MAGYPITFPVAFDIEDKCQKSLSASTQAAIVNTFCEIVENAGYTCMVYTNKNWFENRLAPVAWDHWVAQYDTACTYTQPYKMWQHSSRGTVPGISGYVDMNYLYEDYFNEIIPNGQVTIDGLTYNYSNWLRTNGFRTENGVTYFYDVNGSKVTDKTVTTEDGTIIRMCKDGHVVKSTAEIRNYASKAQAAYQSAAAALKQAQNALSSGIPGCAGSACGCKLHDRAGKPDELPERRDGKDHGSAGSAGGSGSCCGSGKHPGLSPDSVFGIPNRIRADYNEDMRQQMLSHVFFHFQSSFIFTSGRQIAGSSLYHFGEDHHGSESERKSERTSVCPVGGEYPGHREQDPCRPCRGIWSRHL